MIAEPTKPSPAELSEYEKDRVAWNLPKPKTVSPPAWRHLTLVPGPEDVEPGPDTPREQP